jgi:phospholipase/carboxylesterase
MRPRDEPFIRQAGELIFKIRPPQGAGPHPVILLLHGWTGDENSMWVFTPRLPANAWMLAPRALHPAVQGGFSWYGSVTEGWPRVEDFQQAIATIIESLTSRYFPEIEFLVPNDDVTMRPLQLVGFSQGAALSSSLALLNPRHVRAVAGLSGFLPEGFDERIAQLPLRGIPYLIAHGARDELVPVHRARKAIELLSRAGAQVDYCEDDVGHKLSATCFRSLEVFFQDLTP